MTPHLEVSTKQLQGYGLIVVDGADDVLVNADVQEDRCGSVVLRLVVVRGNESRSEIMIRLQGSDRARDVAARLVAAAQKAEVNG